MAIKLPEGTKDLLPEEAAFWSEFKACAQRVFGAYGYKLIETPVFEQTDLFVRGIGEATDVVSKEMFTAISGGNLHTLMEGGKLRSSARLSLRPEGTAGVVRAVVQHDLAPAGAAPAKLMYAGPMFRAERPQKGRQRQFNQVGIECLGAERASADAEGIIMLMRFFAEIGIPADAMELFVNSMGCTACRPTYREAVRAYLAAHEEGLCEDCVRRMELNPLRAFDCKEEGCRAIMDDAPRIVDYLCDDCRAHYDEMKSYLDAAGIAYTEDSKLVRGLDYYTRTVFEVHASGIDGAQNAIGGGGRYDGLAEEVGGRPTPGFGFALGYERCVLALEAAGHELPALPGCTLFAATVGAEQRAAAFGLVQRVRDAGIAADMSHQQRSLKSQFKLADKLGARYVAVIGPDELAAGQVNLRNMETHEEQLVALDEVVAAVSC